MTPWLTPTPGPEATSQMRQERSFTERRKHVIHQCGLGLGTSAFWSDAFGRFRPVADPQTV